jgi:hypothetical protein
VQRPTDGLHDPHPAVLSEVSNHHRALRRSVSAGRQTRRFGFWFLVFGFWFLYFELRDVTAFVIRRT